MKKTLLHDFYLWDTWSGATPLKRVASFLGIHLVGPKHRSGIHNQFAVKSRSIFEVSFNGIFVSPVSTKAQFLPTHYPQFSKACDTSDTIAISNLKVLQLRQRGKVGSNSISDLLTAIETNALQLSQRGEVGNASISDPPTATEVKVLQLRQRGEVGNASISDPPTATEVKVLQLRQRGEVGKASISDVCTATEVKVLQLR
jgi:hypothetical protein